MQRQTEEELDIEHEKLVQPKIASAATGGKEQTKVEEDVCCSISYIRTTTDLAKGRNGMEMQFFSTRRCNVC